MTTLSTFGPQQNPAETPVENDTPNEQVGDAVDPASVNFNREDVPDTAESEPAKPDAAHDLDSEFTDRGGVTLAEYRDAEMVKPPITGDGFPAEINALALAAAGSQASVAGTNSAEPVSDASRTMTAMRIDQSIRGYQSWLDSRSAEERIELRDRPVIFAGDGS